MQEESSISREIVYDFFSLSYDEDLYDQFKKSSDFEEYGTDDTATIMTSNTSIDFIPTTGNIMPLTTSGSDLYNFSTDGSDFNATTSSIRHAEPDIVVIVLLLVVFVIGMIGNFLAIFVILILAEYKRVLTHWYILQLAIADTIFLLTIPIKVAQDLGKELHYQNWMCKARETMFFLNYYASVSFLVLMTVDRYIAICHRFSRTLHKFRNQFATHLATSAVWIISCLICIPVLIYSNSSGVAPKCKCEFAVASVQTCVENPSEFPFAYKNATSESSCHYHNRPTEFKAFIFLNFILMFVSPFIIMSICYTLIALRLRNTGVKTQKTTISKGQASLSPPVCRQGRSKSIVSIRDNRNRNRVTTMCATLVVLFLCCWLPYHAIHLARMRGIAGNDDEYCEQLLHIAFIIAYLSVSSHSALNPCIYNFLGSKSENKLRSAASSVRKSVRNRSVTSISSVRFHSSSRSKASTETFITSGADGNKTPALKTFKPFKTESASSLSKLDNIVVEDNSEDIATT